MITVYGRKTSSDVPAVMWGIAGLGLAHERLDRGHVHGCSDTILRCLAGRAAVETRAEGA